MGMSCTDVDSLIEALFDQDLPESRSREAREHLRGCARCAARYEIAASLPTRLRSLAAPPAPASLTGSVMDAVGRQRRLARASYGLLAVECGLVAVALWYLSGLSGLLAMAGHLTADIGAVMSWSLGGAGLPNLPGSDLFLVIVCLALLAVTVGHLALLARRGGVSSAG
jgi:anti-sigma factor RsiW